MAVEATKRLARRGGWARGAGPAGVMEGVSPQGFAGELRDGREPDDVDRGRGGARSLLDFLEAHVERLTEELAEARTEMRGVRYEAESLRIEAGRAQVLAALVEAERGRAAEIRAERDRLASELAEQRRPWVARVLRAVFDRQPARRRRRAF